MTTAAMVLGVIPLILATGAGAASRFNIGLVIAAGLAIGTLFTLFVVPAVYMLIPEDHHARERVGKPWVSGGGRRRADVAPPRPDLRGWRGSVEGRPISTQITQIKSQITRKVIECASRGVEWLSCAKRHTIIIGVICDLIYVICGVYDCFFRAFATPIPEPSEAAPWRR